MYLWVTSLKQKVKKVVCSPRINAPSITKKEEKQKIYRLETAKMTVLRFFTDLFGGISLEIDSVLTGPYPSTKILHIR